MSGKDYEIYCSEKQLEVIKDACELYSRVQMGQFDLLAEIITRTGWKGEPLRKNSYFYSDKLTDEEIEASEKKQLEEDRITASAIEGALDGIYRKVYSYGLRDRTEEGNIALDIWAKLDGRREDGYTAGNESLIELKEVDKE